MLSAIGNSFRIPELKKKLFFTALMIAIYRLGAHIIVPGLNTDVANRFFAGGGAGGWLGLINMFSGGAFKRFSIFALGIMPYISSSIIFQLLTAVVPYLKKLSKEGEMGRKKITQYTRYGTIVLSIIQSLGLAIWLQSIENGALVNYNTGIGFKLLTILTMTTGTTFIMWLGEQITERGIGNGISIIIFIGIVASIPQGISELFMKLFTTKDLSIFQLLFMIAMTAFVVAFVILIQLGHRRIEVSYSKQIRGRKIYGGQSTYLPLKVDYSGVIAVIFGSSLLMFPSTIINFIAPNDTTFLSKIVDIFNQNSNWNLYHLLYMIFPGIGDGLPFTLLRVISVYNILFSALVIFFCYFYTTIVFNPTDFADNLKRQGGFVPGRRPGQQTAEYIQTILMRITLVGALMVVFICIFPDMLEELLGGNMPQTLKYLLGGTTILILVGVDLDTIQQIEAQLLQRYYTGFIGGGKLRSRRG